MLIIPWHFTSPPPRVGALQVDNRTYRDMRIHFLRSLPDIQLTILYFQARGQVFLVDSSRNRHISRISNCLCLAAL